MDDTRELPPDVPEEKYVKHFPEGRTGNLVKPYLHELYQTLSDEVGCVIGKFNGVRIVMVRERQPNDGFYKEKTEEIIDRYRENGGEW